MTDTSHAHDAAERGRRVDQCVHAACVAIIVAAHGYSEDEVERALVEGTDDYDVGVASEVADITSILRDFLAASLTAATGRSEGGA